MGIIRHGGRGRTLPAVSGVVILAALAIDAFITPVGATAFERFDNRSPKKASTLSEADLPAEGNLSVRPAMVLLGTEGGVAGSTAGGPTGTAVYRNQIVAQMPGVYQPFAGETLADDLTLASGPCNLSSLSLSVAGDGNPAQGTFTVTVQLWDGDPCNAMSSPITPEVVSPPISNDGSIQPISITFPSPIAIPVPTVWLATTFSTDDGGWVVAEQAEIGATANTFSEDHMLPDPPTPGCDLFTLASKRWGGFWAEVRCDLTEPPAGACCDGSTCTLTQEDDCPGMGGIWQGAFSTCDPNVCLSGTCCSGTGFNLCADTTKGNCPSGIFRPGMTCESQPCESTFKVYENDFRTGAFTGVDQDTLLADDLTFGVGTPCELAAYDVSVFGDPTSGPGDFEATVELWTNNDGGTPSNPADDLPGVPIAGTRRSFAGITADFAIRRLLAAGFEGIFVPSKAWLVISTSSDNAGPGLGGDGPLIDIGDSDDDLAFLPPSTSQWRRGLVFCNPGMTACGFDPTGCPENGFTCIPAASFRANVWCAGQAPTGACCDGPSATCAENVPSFACNGRWVQDGACEPETFEPSCGTHACCFPNSQNPNSILCFPHTEAECEALNGQIARGQFCDDITCPTAECFGGTEDCFSAHGSIKCDDAFCTCAVCGEPGQDFCCTDSWDVFCVETANAVCENRGNDDCPDAESIAGPGTFAFDNAEATRDGPDHAACTFSGESQIDHDLWYCWTSTCTETVFLRTCGLTTRDTKFAVYENCDCPPTSDDLLACNDDRCQLASMDTFDAVAGQSYLIRMGTFAGAAGGAGAFQMTCGPPDHPTCPGPANCCTANPEDVAACNIESCCEAVCACDDFCCEMEWDIFCATFGSPQSPNCGAQVLCDDFCVSQCPTGMVEFIAPPPNVVDARRPYPPLTGAPLEGIRQIVASGSPGAQAGCWELCETLEAGNDIDEVIEISGNYIINLVQPLTPGAVTAITYTNDLGESVSGFFTAHPSNCNGDTQANAADIEDLVRVLKGELTTLMWGDFGLDVDHSGRLTPLDLWEAMNLQVGSEMNPMMWNPTTRPSAVGICPPP